MEFFGNLAQEEGDAMKGEKRNAVFLQCTVRSAPRSRSCPSRMVRLLRLFGAVLLAATGCVTTAQQVTELEKTDPREEGQSCGDWNSAEFFEVATALDVTRCLEAGADVAARDDDGLTPLHTAALNGHAEVVETLLDSGADVEARNDRGSTPLFGGNAEIAEALLAAEADVAVRNDDGNTPLHFGPQCGGGAAAGRSGYHGAG